LPQRFFSLRGVEFFGRLNFLKGGIVFADRITTVSEHYKHEMLRPEGGCGLDAVLRENAHKLSGILHGADYERWNPETDARLPARFSAEKSWGKIICRDVLLADMRLAPAPRGPVFGMVTRVVAEKGFSILTPLFDRMLSDDVRLIILGEGDPAFETSLAIASRRYPARFAYRRHYDERLAHLIQAGSDITLVPSQFEPGGLIAMYSLRYGAIPIAQASGGIREIIQDYDPTLPLAEAGYGFLCYNYSPDAFWDSIKRAQFLFPDRTLWTGLIRRAMEREFSWSESAQRYESLYRSLVGKSELAA
jgi:starch synthase